MYLWLYPSSLPVLQSGRFSLLEKIIRVRSFLTCLHVTPFHRIWFACRNFIKLFLNFARLQFCPVAFVGVGSSVFLVLTLNVCFLL